MEIALVIGGTFLVCWLCDKGFTKLFRSRPQHTSGKAVRLSKYFAIGGLLLTVVGVAALITGISQQYWLLLAGGCVVILTGAALLIRYLSFGVFYDEDGFVLSNFAKKSMTYQYRDITSQQLYNSGGSIVIELHLADGRTVLLQSSMVGVYPFLDEAFRHWCEQRGEDPERCAFHDPENSRWFPSVGE